MRNAFFRLEGRYNGASGATVIIDRSTNLVTVRPSRRRKTYTLRLEDLAQTIILRCVKAEIAEKKKLKAARRKGLFA